jgi:SAM-dependent methyltransferase
VKCANCKGKYLTIVLTSLSSVYDRTNNYQIVRCDSCNLTQTSPFPTFNELDNLYSNLYSYDFHELFRLEKTRRAKYLAKFLIKHLGATHFTEFGCGEGVMLKELLLQGFQVAGVELSPSAVMRGNNLLGKEAIKCSSVENELVNITTIPGSVLMSHCLEHLLDPIGVLTDISLKMKSGNYLLLVVPNLESGISKLYPKFWGYWQVPVHTFHFSVGDLQPILESLDFKLEKVHYRNIDLMGIGLFISNVMRLKSSEIGPSYLTKQFLRLTSMFYSYLPPRIGRDDLILLARKI